ncbi:MAG: gliding motility-associated C-terminal domain-containing protein [Bacteroidota bacterium]
MYARVWCACLYGTIITFFAQNTTSLQAHCGVFTSSTTTYLQVACDSDAVFCTNLSYQDQINTTFYVNDVPTAMLEGCDFDTLRFYPIDPLIAVGSLAPYYLNDWCVNTDCYSTEFRYVSQVVDSMNIWDATGNWTYSFLDGRITGGDPQNTYADLNIEVIISSANFSAAYQQQTLPQHRGIRLPFGRNEVRAIDSSTQCIEELIVEVVCTSKSIIPLQLEQGRSRQICLETAELHGTISSIRQLNSSMSNYSWERIAGTENCIQWTGQDTGTATAILLSCDTFGICDTTEVAVEVTLPKTRTVYTALLVNEEEEFCLSDSPIQLPGTLKTVEFFCESTLETTYNEQTNCLSYTTDQVEQSSECLRFCDTFGNCDTLTLQIQAVEPIIVYDTLLVGSGRGEYCLDAIGFEQASLRIESVCERTSNIISFNTNTLCFNYASDTSTRDSVCVWLMDEQGNASYIVLNVLISPPLPSVIQTTVFVDQTLTTCINLDELPGALRTFENVCSSSSEVVDFFATTASCIEITGLELGTAKSCWVACDQFAYCDTTYLQVQVTPYPFPPRAQHDTVRLSQMASATVRVQANDTIFGGLERMRISVPPTYGNATVDEESIIYIPDPQNCIGRDVFEYEICNSVGCDVAEVVLEVQCSAVEVFTAMSPNGDGINDAFFVANLEAYPENSLKIYNRWGALVYEQENYQNNWYGTWRGRMLPDGTYFFLLEIQVEEDTQIHRGYITIHR